MADDAAAQMAALLASLPTHCTPMPMKADVAGYLAANTVLSALMVVVVGGRVYVRARGPGFAKDDWVVLVACVFTLVLLAIQGVHSACGSGYNIDEAILDLPFTLRLAFAFQLLVIFSLAAVKFSMLFFYLRVFRGEILRRFVLATMGLLAVWTITYTFTVIFTCKPISGQWDPSLTTAVCIDQIPMLQSIVFSNVFLDIIIMALPIPTILGLQMKLSDKIGVLACILIGTVAVVTGIIRGFYLATADMRVNITGTIPPSIFMSALEPILSVTCVSLPSLRPMWRRLRGDPTSSAGTARLTDQEQSNHKNSKNKSSNLSRNQDPERQFASVHRDLEMDTMHDLRDDESGSERNLTTGDANHIVVESKWSGM